MYTGMYTGTYTGVHWTYTGVHWKNTTVLPYPLGAPVQLGSASHCFLVGDLSGRWARSGSLLVAMRCQCVGLRGASGVIVLPIFVHQLPRKDRQAQSTAMHSARRKPVLEVSPRTFAFVASARAPLGACEDNYLRLLTALERNITPMHNTKGCV